MKNWKTWAPIIVAIIIAILGWFIFGKPDPTQTTSDSSLNIATQEQMGDIVIGDKIKGDKIVNIGKIERKLSRGQINELKELIKTDKGKIGFVSKIFDSESKNFAASISNVFSEVGWEVVYPINQSLLDDFDGDATIFASSIEFYVRANLVCSALNQINIVCGHREIRNGAVSGNFATDTIYLVIDSQ